MPLIVLGLGTGSAFALTDEEIFRDFRFNLINPGARSLGLGGAFISLADDATAAQANPAGLGYLRTREFFVELRVLDSGSETTDIQDALPGGGTTTVLTGTDPEDVVSPSFASAVFPIDKVILAISRQVVLRTTNATLNSFTIAFGASGSGTSTAEGTGSIDVTQTNWNGSIGFRVNDRLAFGGSIVVGRLDVTSEVENLVFDPNGNFSGTPIIEPTLDLRTRIDDRDQAYGFNAGVLVRPKPAFSVGAVYRRTPKFTVVETIDPGVDTDGDGDFDEGIDVFNVRGVIGDEFDNQFNIPDSYGISGSWHATEKWTFAMDVERVQYSDLVDGFVPGVNVLTGFDAEFTADDATDYRLGGEYVMLARGHLPIAFRAGVFTVSDSTVRALDTGTGAFATPASFPGRDREIHGSIGLGVGWERQQIDLGLELGNSGNQFVASYIFKGR